MVPDLMPPIRRGSSWKNLVLDPMWTKGTQHPRWQSRSVGPRRSAGEPGQDWHRRSVPHAEHALRKHNRRARLRSSALLTRSLKIKEDLAARGYDAARPALSTDGTMSEASQKKALDMVLKSAGVKEALPLDRFFNFAITRKVNSELQAKGWKPAP
jgi:hypothetical protein